MGRLLALVASILALLTGTVHAAAGKVYTFGVVPQQSATELAETWGPVLAWLSARSGIELRFATAPNIPTFEQRVANGEYDFAYMNPYHFTVFNDKPGYRALARAKDQRIKGIVVVGKDSPISDLNALSGKTLVFPAPAAFAASILPRAELRRQGIDFKPRFVSSHDSVYLNVAKGLYPAGGGILRTLELLDEPVRRQLRVLWTTPGFTAHAIASHPRMEEAVRERILQAMLAMNSDAKGLEILAKIGFKGVEAARDGDWDDIRRLKIQPSDSQIQD